MTIEQIKSRLTILEVLRHYNLEPDSNNRLRCPWHNDKTPSLQIYPETNTWTCFSCNCNAGSGDVIDFVMKLEQVTKRTAILKCKKLIGVEATEPKKNKQGMDLSRIAILTKYYEARRKTTSKSHDGTAYAKSRGLNYKSGLFAYMGKIGDLQWKGEMRASILAMGIQRFKRCLLFAMRNRQGQIVNLYGRSIYGSNADRHFYLRGQLQGLYPKWPGEHTKKLLLTESHIDAATVIEHVGAIEGATMSLEWQTLALYGTNGFTEDHKTVIGELSQLEEVILFMDGDAAGQEALRKLGYKIKELRKDIRLSYVATPQGEDPNSLVQKELAQREQESLNSTKVLTELLENRKELLLSIEEKPSTEKYDPLLEQAPLQEDRTGRGKLITDNIEMLVYHYGSLQITLMGGIKITGLDRLRVTARVKRIDSSAHIPIRHSLDLYHAKQVELLCQKIADQLDLSSGQVELIISYMTTALEEYRAKRLALLKPKVKVAYQMQEEERKTAMSYLGQQGLFAQTIEDLGKTGIIGETKNGMIALMAYTSRKREKPLHIMCLGASGTGKTYLQEKVGSLIPEEDKIEITSLSDNALYYFGRHELKHKLILIEDLDGAENVMYPLRELQSKRRISKTVTTKDNKGILKTLTLTVEGPVSVSGCTTRERIYEDNANRCILLYIDSSSDQDKRIMDYQRKISAGKISLADEKRMTQLFQNVQRLLRPIKVINPYAEVIVLPQEVFKPRRTLLLLLSFIETITFYHQYQREVKTNPVTGERYIESTIEDIELGLDILKEVLFNKSDELSKASRRFLERLKGTIGEGATFYTQEIRKSFRLSSTSVHRYIRELRINGYIKHKGGNRQRGYEYLISDYDEYKDLKSAIDDQLHQIISQITDMGKMESHKYPTHQNGIHNLQTVNGLA